MDRMKKIKRQLSMTLRGGRAPEKSLGEPRDSHGSDSGERCPFKRGAAPLSEATPPLNEATPPLVLIPPLSKRGACGFKRAGMEVGGGWGCLAL
uniref:Uncharacterized protein n=1 Tax=Amazona collaria TaxID=241587 RepID=A0A8B9FRX4_9PSIT